MLTNSVKVLDYDSAWAKEFTYLKDYLQSVIPKSYDIIHVGSTSVLYLASKPIIDLDIVYEDERDKVFLIDLLTELGYLHEGDLGIKNREAFTYQTTSFMTHHLYLVKYNSKAYKDHVYLKEYLSQHNNKRDAYGALKKQLAQQFPHDINAYMRGKDEMIRDILVKAYAKKME